MMAVDAAGPLLSIRDVSKTFPGLKALDGVSTEVSSGEIVALVGQNGSGKSTLVKILAGVYQADPGSEVALGEDAEGHPAGLHFIHQDLGLVGGLSTIENLDLDRTLGLGALLPPERSERRRAEELVAGFGGNFDVGAPVDRLSAAERTTVAIARALAGWDHSRNVLVLDEPTVSLHGSEVDKLFEAVRQVAARGAGVIFISHRLEEVIELADRVVVLRDGRLIADVGRGEYDHDDLVRMIAGEIASTDAAHQPPRRDKPPVLSARGIRAATIADLDLDLYPGEILGVSGVLGSGREEVASVLFGARVGTVSELRLDGELLTGEMNPRRAIAHGVAYVPGERHREGAVMTMSLRENLTLPRLAPLRGAFGSLRRRAEREEARGWIERVAVRPADPERQLGLFSGGNQQKVVLAKWLRNEPRVLLMDEPTQGVDVGAKAGIFELIANAASAGAGVLICSSDAKELALICDRVLVMRDGLLVAEAGRASLSEAALVAAGLGVNPDRPHRNEAITDAN
jgi:ABC-type sugar transport system ATPase subunit